ncbi:TIGR03620 family F420-dependent LLM class oxidoreductase [Amycolatopsis nigrescens]|uniref:TIGR03620 family F420-dependent LLM class oxidoreductase n=1 Tax=Amycolatopsis nigrescens TaxID=381445 RepID=UPI00039E484D|nr:TIGR03620 family F420-dependent LLM class oxidoreductase [Amycolatopsis nigrescens]
MGTEMVERTRRELGRVGVWLFGAHSPDPVVERRETARIERLGYGSVWSGEGGGSREILAAHGFLLQATERLVLGTGIANVWSRPARTLHAGAYTLARAFPGRFVLGVGIGHSFQAAKAGSHYDPLTQLREYLSEMDEAAAELPPPEPFPRVLAAVGPKMLELSGDRADGAHPFSTPPEHVAFAREILGEDKLLIPHQPVLLETDPERARAVAREILKRVLAVPAYAASWRKFGYGDDLAGLTDRLVDAAVAWGDEEAIARRVRELLDSGADHVLVSPVADDLPAATDQLARLAPALLVR